MPSRQSWSAFTASSEVNRRAAGRRKYNAVRRLNADLRRVQVQKLILEYGFVHGSRARIAARARGAPVDHHRDVGRLSGVGGEKVCPECERPMSDKRWDQLEEGRAKRAYNVLAETRGISGVA